jgi:polyisoprenoid-binding protein YceI
VKKPVLIAAAAVVVLLVGALVAYKVFLEDDAEPELGLTSTTTTEGGGDGTTTSTAPSNDGGGSLDGTWTVAAGAPTEAGLRIKEKFLGGIADHTAVGRSPEVEGSLTVDGTTVSDGSFTVDLTALEFTDAPPGLDVANRARAMRDAGLETNEFPEATFTLTEPIDFGEVPAEDSPISADARGELTLHGVTKTVSFSVDAQLVDGQIEVATSDPVEITLADYEIDAPVQGPVAEVADTGSFEFLIRLAKD